MQDELDNLLEEELIVAFICDESEYSIFEIC